MNPSLGETKPFVTRVVREAALGHALFSTKDPERWRSRSEDLGKLCAEVWYDDLPERDRAWAAAHRESFRKWVDDQGPNGTEPGASESALRGSQGHIPRTFTPPWPMLLAAVESAFLAFVNAFDETPASDGEQAPAAAASRLQRTYLWRTLASDDTAEQHRPGMLRAFQRGFRLALRGAPSSMKRPIPPMLEPPWYWGAGLPEYPGPSAARERALRAERDQALQAPPVPGDRQGWLTRQQELRALYASAWRDDVPEEDREWAQAVRDCCTRHVNRRRRDAIAQSAYESYLQSSGGVFDRAPGRPWPNLSHHASEPWRAFVDRVDDAPDGESEIETAEAAAREYWDTLYREAPPWDSDPDQAHWLAAVRAARAKAQADDSPPERAR
ncbi:hypothetical protein WME73_37805 [Sorangium sp. So ce302]|uniref:hypothetical protein n=1 Tax=unclassified Sorangium TaxID=2621164 RepID=UPI003F6078E2